MSYIRIEDKMGTDLDGLHIELGEGVAEFFIKRPEEISTTLLRIMTMLIRELNLEEAEDILVWELSAETLRNAIDTLRNNLKVRGKP